MTNIYKNIEISQARALIKEYGNKAIEVAKRRIQLLEKGQYSREIDFNYRVLNQVEKMLPRTQLASNQAAS